jgi:hypothetical protein
MNSNKKDLSPEQRAELLRALKARFEKNMNRHKGLEWGTGNRGQTGRFPFFD